MQALQNVGGRSCYVQAQCPVSKHFSLRGENQDTPTNLPAIRLAPGMNTSFELVFNAVNMEVAEDYFAELCVRHDSDKYMVPIRCSAPKAECVLDGGLDFGFVTCGGPDPSRQVYIVNQGNRPGSWAIALGEGTIPLQLKPNSGSLEPGDRQALTATLQEISAGEYTASVALSTDGRPNPKRYSCNAQAVTAAFQVVGSSGQTVLDVCSSLLSMLHSYNRNMYTCLLLYVSPL
jgi:hypothetical protein